MEPEIEITQEVQDAVDELKLDSRETAFFARELEHIKSQTYDVLFPDNKARQFAPVSHDADPDDEKITYRQWTPYGMATIVSHWADDVALVEVTGKEFSTKVVEIANGYGYSRRELSQSAKLGRSLPAMKAQAAARFIENRIDDIGAFGIPELDIPGITNNPNVTLLTLPTGAWASASAENILADMNYMVTQIVTLTKQAMIPDTIVLPTALYLLISQKVAGNQLNDTVLNIFLKTNPYIKNVETWVKLDTAAADGSGRVMCYKRDPMVLQYEIPQEMRQEAPQVVNRGVKVELNARVGGVVVRYPIGMAYADNAI